jgi:cytidylate kinase
VKEMNEIICIGGYTGSGKDTIADIVANKLNFKRIKFSFKDIAKEIGISLMEYQRRAERDLTIDRKFDQKVIAAAKGKCIISTWIAAWMVKKAVLRVFLEASESERAKRIAKRDGMSYSEALKHIRDRDTHNRGRYMALYKIDIYDKSIFDLIINTEKFTPEQSAEIIIAAYREKVKK